MFEYAINFVREGVDVIQLRPIINVFIFESLNFKGRWMYSEGVLDAFSASHLVLSDQNQHPLPSLSQTEISERICTLEQKKFKLFYRKLGS